MMEKNELKDKIRTAMDMEQRSAVMASVSPLHISHMINEPLEDVEKAMKEMGI